MTEPPDPGSAKYDVEITGGKGAVVGDYATVFQVFTQASGPLASLIRTREFEALIEERTRDFVGRQFVFAAIDAVLKSDEFPSGYVVVQGEPGIGKTTLSAKLVKEYGCVHHFNIAAQGIRSPQAFLSNICAQLVVRYELDHAMLPAEATHDSGFLLRLLTEAVTDGQNTPLVVVVDALDEAEDVGIDSRANRLFLPPTLPPGVFFVVTTRELHDYKLFVDARRDIFLNEDDPQNLADVRAYIRRVVDADDPQLAARIEGWDAPGEGFVEALAEKSEGNFMYLVHVLGDIRSGALTASNIDDVRRLPVGLRAYYRRHWTDMRSRDPEQFRRYQQPIVSLLATVREPVSAIELLDWTAEFWRRSGWDPAALDATAVKDVLDAWREFIHVDETEDGGPLYALYHASFRDFLQDEIGLAVYHETIGDLALAKLPGFLDER